MLKNIIKSAAALLLASGSTLAMDVSGNYVSRNNGQEIGMELSGEGQIRGAFIMNGKRVGLVAQESNGQLRGIIQASDGPIPFVGAMTRDGLVIEIDGRPLLLTPARGNRQPNVAPREVAPRGVNPRVENGRNQQPAAGPLSYRIEQGEIFSTPVPQGWLTSQSINETYSASPDGKLGFGFVGLEAVGAATPTQFAQFIFNLYGNKNLQVSDVRRVQYPGATEAIEAQVSFVSKDGNPSVGWIRVATFVSGGSMNGYMVFASGTPDRFEAVADQLIEMVEKIQITNANRAFDRDRRMQNIQMVQNRPMDHGFADGYWKNQKRVEGAMARGSDVRRDRYISSDPVSGERFEHGQDAYDPARGGVQNPNRPTENLRPAPHWMGR